MKLISAYSSKINYRLGEKKKEPRDMLISLSETGWLSSTGFVKGTAEAIKLNVKDTGSLPLVMFYPDGEEKSSKVFRL